jgi:hypothetical protein
MTTPRTLSPDAMAVAREILDQFHARIMKRRQLYINNPLPILSQKERTFGEALDILNHVVADVTGIDLSYTEEPWD